MLNKFTGFSCSDQVILYITTLLVHVKLYPNIFNLIAPYILLTIRCDTSSSELDLKLLVLLDVLVFSIKWPAQLDLLCQAVVAYLSR